MAVPKLYSIHRLANQILYLTIRCVSHRLSTVVNNRVRETTYLQVVHNCSGYATVWWALGIYQVLVLVTGGAAWILGRCNMHAVLWTMQKCPLSRAEFVLVQVTSVSYIAAQQSRQRLTQSAFFSSSTDVKS